MRIVGAEYMVKEIASARARSPSLSKLLAVSREEGILP